MSASVAASPLSHHYPCVLLTRPILSKFIARSAVQATRAAAPVAAASVAAPATPVAAAPVARTAAAPVASSPAPVPAPQVRRECREYSEYREYRSGQYRYYIARYKENRKSTESTGGIEESESTLIYVLTWSPSSSSSAPPDEPCRVAANTVEHEELDQRKPPAASPRAAPRNRNHTYTVEGVWFLKRLTLL